MATSIQTTVTAPAAAGEAIATAVAARRPNWLRRGIIIAVIVALVGGVYLFAWLDAYNLGNTYLQDADASYSAGKYLQALVGYEDFDTSRNAYVTHGGYLQVQKIWSDPYAWPVPAGVDRAQVRINEIINQRMTVEDAEQFVQENTGKRNPYFGVIYLRLGELYEQKGDIKDAKDVYQTAIDSFADQPDIVARAKDHLDKLNGK